MILQCGRDLGQRQIKYHLQNSAFTHGQFTRIIKIFLAPTTHVKVHLQYYTETSIAALPYASSIYSRKNYFTSRFR